MVATVVTEDAVVELRGRLRGSADPGRRSEAASDEVATEWNRDVASELAGIGTGAPRTPTRRPPRAPHGPNLRRLAQVKAVCDPENLFRRNSNVEPAQA